MKINTIDDLISELEEARDEMGGSTPVRIAYQQNYPIRGTIEHVTIPESRDNPYNEDEQAPGQDADGQMLWLAIGSVPYTENPYGPRWAWNG